MAAPVVVLNAAIVPFPYQENDPAKILAPLATVSNPDNLANFGGGSVQASINNAKNTSADVLSVQAGNGVGFGATPNDIVFTSGNTTVPIGTITSDGHGTNPLTITLLAGATPGDVQQLVRQIQYQNTSDDPVTGLTVKFDVDSGAAGNSKGTASLDVGITSINDRPIRTAGTVADHTFVEGQAGLALPNGTGLSLGLTNVAYDAVEAGQTLTFTVTSVPDPATLGAVVLPNGTGVAAGITLSLAEIRSLKFLAVNDNANGSAVFTYTIKDNGGTANGGADTLAESMVINVTAVNDPPTLDATPGQVTVANGSGITSIPLTGISVGPANEAASQTLDPITVTSNAPGLFQVLDIQPVQGDPTKRTLRIQPAAGVNTGDATITITLHDNGGIANNGVDTLVRTINFSINGRPTARDLAIDRDVNAGAFVIDLKTLVSDDRLQLKDLTYNIVTNPSSTVGTIAPVVNGVAINDGVVTFTPAPGAVGSTSFTYSVSDDGVPVGSGTGALTSDVHTVTIGIANKTDVSVAYVDATNNAQALSALPAVLAGETLTFAVKVTNGGPGTAQGISFTDALPAGTTFVAALSSPGLSLANNALSATIASLAPNASQVFTIAIRPTTAAPTAINNRASVAHLPDDTNAGNDAATIGGTVAQIRFSQGNYDAPEGDAGTSPRTFQIVLTADLGRTVTVNVADVAGTATRNADYQAVNQAIPVGPSAGAYPSANASVQVIGDKLLESNEVFSLVASYPQAGNPLPIAPSATVTIVDDDTLLVSTTNPTGPKSLLEAIRAANVSPNATVGGVVQPNVITFDPTVFQDDATSTITLTAALEAITQPTVIDGRLPGGRSVHLLASGNVGPALTIQYANGAPTAGSTLVGLVIQGFNGGVLLSGGGGHRITGDQFVNDSTYAIRLDNSSANTIGGIAGGEGNVVAGSPAGTAGVGIELINGSSNNAIFGNRIGADASGVAAPFTLGGIAIRSGSNNQVGGVSSDGTRSQGGNAISFTSGAGVLVEAGNGNAIRGNSIASSITNNTGPGIDLSPGANNNQPAPTIGGATFANGTLSLQVSANFGAPAAAKNFAFDFYAEPVQTPGVLPPGKPGEGPIFLGSVTMSGQAAAAGFSATIATLNVQVGQFVTATATPVDSPQSTSEFSNFQVVTLPTVVRNTNDSGPNSLRAAIDFANMQVLQPGQAVTITFDIGNNSDEADIHLLSPLPTLTTRVIVDASRPGQVNTQAAADNARPYVVIDGGATVADGLTLTAGGVVRGLVFQDFLDSGLVLRGGSGYQVEGNFLGISAAGTGLSDLLKIRGDAVRVVDAADVVIGGASIAARNIISGAGQAGSNASGVHVLGSSSGVVIQNNFIGADPSGTKDFGNTGDGVFVDGVSGVSILGNLILGNDRYGVEIDGANGGLLANNQIGRANAGNSLGGILLDAAQNVTVGGLAAAQNGIAANGGPGVTASLGSGHVIAGDFIGTDGLGTTGIGNAGAGVRILDSSDVTVGQIDALLGRLADQNAIAGNVGHGVEVTGNAALRATIRGNVIAGNAGDGVSVHDIAAGPGASVAGTAIVGNAISGGQRVTVPGGAVVRNGDGVRVTNAPFTSIRNNTIGSVAGGATGAANAGSGVVVSGTGSAASASGVAVAGNVLSGNRRFGLEVANSFGLVASGNEIGTNPDGNGRIANALGGVLFDASGNNTLGGNIADERNVISGNGGAGVSLTGGAATSGNAILGNFIGTTADGGSKLGNGGPGVVLNGVTGNSIGGLGATLSGIAGTGRNVISANAGDGLSVIGAGASMNAVVNNFIGTDANGASALGNTGSGISIVDVQGTAASPFAIRGNVISGNVAAGVTIRGAAGVLIAGNEIGTNASGNGPVGNAVGISILNAPNISIGGSADADRNVISGNAGDGVDIVGAPGASVIGNRIGTDPSGALAIGNIGSGVSISGSSGVTLGGPATGLGNVISANGGAGIVASGTSTTGLQIVGNLVGLGTAPAAPARGNRQDGIRLTDTPSVLVSANSIGANTGDGVGLLGAATATIRGNTIGTAFSGAIPFGNTGAGISLGGSASATIGAAAGGPDSDGNVIVGNLGAGILAVGTPGSIEIRGNFIGTDAKGSPNLGNVAAGVQIERTGAATVIGNVIGGNLGDGLIASSMSGLVVRDNFIGTTLDSIHAVPNRQNGLDLVGLTSATIGALDAPNVVVNNGANGIRVAGVSSLVYVVGNLVGVDKLVGADGQRGKQANLGRGVLISATAPAGSVGMTSVVLNSDEIANNRQGGVRLEGATGVSLGLGDSIHNNEGHGVEIAGNSSSNAILGVTITANQADGLRISGGAGNVVRESVLSGNAGYGAAIFVADGGSDTGGAPLGAVGNSLLGNTIVGNRNSGLLISGPAFNNLAASNTIGGAAGLGNLTDGVTILQAGRGNSLTGNMVVGNGNNGVAISQTDGTVISGNYLGIDKSGADGLGNRNFGLFLSQSSNSTISGNFISGNQSHGVVLANTSMGNVIEANQIGAFNGVARGNKLAGVFVVDSSNNLIGGAPKLGNVIAANESDGVVIFRGSGNRVLGNFIGSLGSDDLGNKGDGINVIDSASNTIGGPGAGDLNLIAANKKSGIEIFGNSTGNVVRGNLIGGAGVLGNKLQGVLIDGSPDGGSRPVGNLIGAGNAISGSGANGVQIVSADANTVSGVAVTRSGVDGIAINSANNNVVASSSATFSGGNGVSIFAADGNAVRGTVVRNNAKDGFLISSAKNSVLSDNQVDGNTLDGIALNAAANTTIGAGNRVTGNGADGLAATSSVGTVIFGNTFAGNSADGIGLISSTGSVLLANTISGSRIDGVRVEQGSTGNRIGVPGPASARNVIVGNQGAGVEILIGGLQNSSTTAAPASGNTVENDLIGLDAAGNAAGNRIGVLLNNVPANTVRGNVISGNIQSGVQILQGSGNTLVSNLIGTDPTGEAAVPNGSTSPAGDGVLVSGSANNIIGGADGQGNLISGNQGSGVQLFGQGSTGNVVSHNLIGSNAGGTRPIVIPGAGGADVYSSANRQDDGILVSNASGNTLDRNTILANQDGIRVTGALATGNAITNNQVGLAQAAGDTSVTDRLGNFFGIAVEGASRNIVQANVVQGNVSVGVEIKGAASGANVVKGNTISGNGGFGNRLVNGDSTLNTIVQLTTPVTSSQVFGVGVYLEGAKGNVVGSIPKSNGKKKVENPADGNAIRDNILVDIYLFQGASGNIIRGNTVKGTPGVGAYGIFLFNSAGNLNTVARQGKHANKIAGHTIANFREFTGPVPGKPTTVADLPRGPLSGAKPNKAKSAAAHRRTHD